MALIESSVKWRKKKERKIRKIRKKNVSMTSGKGEKWWEVSPTLINSGMRIKREKEEKKREKNRGRKLIERGRKGEKRKGRFSRRSDSPRVKVYPRNQGYAWVPKSGSFVKFQEIENFHTLIIFSLKVI